MNLNLRPTLILENKRSHFPKKEVVILMYLKMTSNVDPKGWSNSICIQRVHLKFNLTGVIDNLSYSKSYCKCFININLTFVLSLAHEDDWPSSASLHR